jgi:hypothetical protein
VYVASALFLHSYEKLLFVHYELSSQYKQSKISLGHILKSMADDGNKV